MFSQTSEYAIRALQILAEYPEGEYVLVGTLANRAGLPHHYLSKILQNMVRVQILESRKGSRGGFRLASPASEITLYDIVNAIENLNKVRRCLLGQEICDDERACPLHEFWGKQSEVYLATLRNTTLGDLLDFNEKNKDRIGAYSPMTKDS